MNLFKYLLLFLIIVNPKILSGCCFGEYFSITELLNHDPNNHHIFTCEIIETYRKGFSYESIAVVQRKFKGTPNDTIYINSGGGTTAGGQKLMPKSIWLIFSTTKDNMHYGATVCDGLSVEISRTEDNSCLRNISPYTEIFLDVLESYESINKIKFSGYKEIIGGGNIIA